MITLEQARRAAEEFLDSNVRERFDFDVVIIDYLVEDTGQSWKFPYDGRGYVEGYSKLEMMAGNAPLLVDKVTGRVDFAV
jgi:hypothetical protein